MTQKKFNFIMIVWGKEYTDFFLDFSLPSLLAKKNIPLCSSKLLLEMDIYTSNEDAERMRSHPCFKELQKYCSPSFFPLAQGEHLSLNKYALRGQCVSLAMRKAISQGSQVLLLGSPDVLWANGSFTKCCELIEKGFDVVQVSALNRVERESIIPILKRDFLNKNSLPLTLANRDLINLGINHMHQVGKDAFWDAENFICWPACAYWKISSHSLIAKFFHLQPIAIHFHNLKKEIPEQLMTDDGGLIEFLEIPKSRIYTVTNTDEIALLEVSKKDLTFNTVKPKSKSYHILQWIIQNDIMTEHCNNFLNYTIRFVGDNKLIKWKEAEAKAAIDILPLRILLKLPLRQILCPKNVAIKTWRLFFSKIPFLAKRKDALKKFYKKIWNH